MPKPMICAMHRYVMGSGVEMAMLCDLRIASDDVVFAMPEVALGMIPAAGGSQTVPWGIGASPALEALLLNRRIGAHEALRIGLVHRLVQGNALQGEATQMAQTLLQRGSTWLQATREAVRRGAELPLDRGLELEERLALQVWQERQAQPAGTP
jgi:E-phenylitaconyl-CoA hydratase